MSYLTFKVPNYYADYQDLLDFINFLNHNQSEKLKSDLHFHLHTMIIQKFCNTVLFIAVTELTSFRVSFNAHRAVLEFLFTFTVIVQRFQNWL